MGLFSANWSCSFLQMLGTAAHRIPGSQKIEIPGILGWPGAQPYRNLESKYAAGKSNASQTNQYHCLTNLFALRVGGWQCRSANRVSYPSRRSHSGSRVALPSAVIAATTVDPVAINSSAKWISYSWVMRTFLAWATLALMVSRSS